MSERTAYQQLAAAADTGFEVSGELLGCRQGLAAANRWDDAEQPYWLRLFNQIALLPEGERNLLLPTFLELRQRDRQQRRETDGVGLHADRASHYQRLYNRLIDGALERLRLLSGLGKRRPGSGPEAA